MSYLSKNFQENELPIISVVVLIAVLGTAIYFLINIIHFASPYFLYLLFLLPLVVWKYWVGVMHNKAAVQFSNVRVFEQMEKPLTVKLRHLLIVLKVIALTLFIIALARPQSGSRTTESSTEGIDIVLTIDVSGSMRAEDFKPKNRLHVAKKVVADFIEDRKELNDRLGMVVFAGKSYTQCPLTLDYDVFLQFLEPVHIGMIEDGTAIGMAIANSLNRLRKSEAKSKVIILLTDGVNNRGEIDPLTAAEAAKALGVKIYTIGVGTQGTAPYPVEDPFFGKRYVNVPVELDEEVLRQIAEITGGLYFRATNAQALAEIYKEIGDLEKTKIEVKEYIQYAELFNYFVITGAIILLVDIVLGNTVFRKIP